MDRIIKEDIDRIIKDGGDMWEQLAGKNILITGATGLIGYYFTITLLTLNDTLLKGRECRVYALSRSIDKAVMKFKDYVGRKDIRFLINGEYRDIDIEAKIDFLIHAASPASTGQFKESPLSAFGANAIGTIHLMSLFPGRFLFISGGEVYGKGQLTTPTKEIDYGWLDPLDTRSCYAESKRAGENLCACFKVKFGQDFVVARLAHTYGPGVRREDGRVFADFAYDIIDDKNLTIKGDGSAIRSFCYLSDAVLGLFIILLNGQSGKAYNLCNEEASTSIFDLATTLAEHYHTGVKVLLGHTDPLAKSCLDSTELRKLGWKPKVDILTGFTRTIESIRESYAVSS